MRALVLWLCAVSSSGCFAIADLDRFETEGGGTERNPFQMHVCEFTSHPMERVEFRILSGSEADIAMRRPSLLGLAVLHPLAAQEGHFIMPGLLDDGAAHLDFWVDISNGGSLDDLDHQWREDVPASGEEIFVHDPVFDVEVTTAEFNRRSDFVFQLRNAEMFAGTLIDRRHLEVRVVEHLGGRPVITRGLYRIVLVREFANTDLTLPGIVEPGLEYRVEIFVDMNGNRLYEPMEPSWVIDTTGTPGTLTVTADLSTLVEFETESRNPTDEACR